MNRFGNKYGFRAAVGPKIGGRCLLSDRPDIDLRGSMAKVLFLHAVEVELLEWDDRE
jgi:hypothetical protein